MKVKKAEVMKAGGMGIEEETGLGRLPLKVVRRLVEIGAVEVGKEVEMELEEVQRRAGSGVDFDRFLEYAKRMYGAVKRILDRRSCMSFNELAKDKEYQREVKEMNEGLMAQKVPSNVAKDVCGVRQHPLINALADEDDEVNVAELPLSIQKKLENKGLAKLPKIEQLSEEESKI
mmetsp:Transcript_41119/g.47329  ORF Transcript_41119/g.47329 Transcript_41119/m.47329 type:complete len:175 (-) Transcript_41119:1553-2077(-)